MNLEKLRSTLKTELTHSWKRRLTALVRDVLVIVVLLTLVEAWQARDLASGSLPLKLETLPELHGQSSATVSGSRYTLLYVFAPWCGVCKLSAPNLNRLQSLSLDVRALALSWGEVSEVQAFVDRSGLNVPVLLGTSQEEEALRIAAFPTHYLIAPDGKIIKAWSGYTTTPGFYWKYATSSLLHALF